MKKDFDHTKNSILEACNITKEEVLLQIDKFREWRSSDGKTKMISEYIETVLGKILGGDEDEARLNVLGNIIHLLDMEEKVSKMVMLVAACKLTSLIEPIETRLSEKQNSFLDRVTERSKDLDDLEGAILSSVRDSDVEIIEVLKIIPKLLIHNGELRVSMDLMQLAANVVTGDGENNSEKVKEKMEEDIKQKMEKEFKETENKEPVGTIQA